LGMGLLVLTLAFSFTGYLLPWDQLAFWAVTIGSNIAASPRELTDALGITQYFDPGGFIKEVILGGTKVGGEALIRFYVLHVIVLPVIFAAVLAVHFWRIRKDGGLARPSGPTAAGKGAAPSGSPPEKPAENPTKTYGLMCLVKDRRPATNLDPEDTVPSWPYLLRAELLIFMTVMLLCTILGFWFDAPLKEMANASIPENPAKAPWYFLGLQEIVSYSAFVGGLVVPTLAVIGLALIPYLDREKEEPGLYFAGRAGRRVIWQSVIFAAAASILAVAVPVHFGWLRTWYPDIDQLVIILLNPGTLLTLAFVFWSVWVMKRTRSHRMAALAIFTCFIVGFAILTYVGSELRGPNWDFYWSKSDWPVH